MGQGTAKPGVSFFLYIFSQSATIKALNKIDQILQFDHLLLLAALSDYHLSSFFPRAQLSFSPDFLQLASLSPSYLTGLTKIHKMEAYSLSQMSRNKYAQS